MWYHLYGESKKINKWYKWTYSQNRNKLTDTESKLIDTKGDEKGKLEAWG